MTETKEDCTCAVCVAINAIEENCRLNVSRTLLACMEVCKGDPKRMEAPDVLKIMEDGKAGLLEHARKELRAIPVDQLFEKVATQIVNSVGESVCNEARMIAIVAGRKAGMIRLRDTIEAIEAKQTRTE